MAYFDKETYERKREYAYNRSWESKEIIAKALGIDEDDERLIALGELSHIRHEIHSTQHPESLVSGNNFELKQNCDLVGHQFSCGGELSTLVDDLHLIDQCFPTITLPETSDEIDTFRERIEYFGEKVPEDWDDEENYDELCNLCYEVEYFGCREIIDAWSKDVRDWFRQVNEKYGTSFPQ